MPSGPGPRARWCATAWSTGRAWSARPGRSGARRDAGAGARPTDSSSTRSWDCCPRTSRSAWPFASASTRSRPLSLSGLVEALLPFLAVWLITRSADEGLRLVVALLTPAIWLICLAGFSRAFAAWAFHETSGSYLVEAGLRRDEGLGHTAPPATPRSSRSPGRLLDAPRDARQGRAPTAMEPSCSAASCPT